VNDKTVNDPNVTNVKEKILDEKTMEELKGFDEEVPKWDIALAALATEEAGIMGY
jgi:hypothetical protein